MQNAVINQFKENYSKVLKKEAEFVENKLLFIEIPENGRAPENMTTIIQVINDFVQDLHMFTCMDGIFDFSITNGDWVMTEVDEPIHLTFRELEHPGKNSKPYVVISFNELNFDPENKYELYPRWWTLKDTFNSPYVVSIYDIDPYYNVKLELGDIEKIGFNRLFNMVNDYDIINQRYEKLTAEEREYIYYILGKQLSVEIKQYTEDKTIDEQTYIDLLDEDLLHFTTNLQPFNYSGKSFVLNTISGQGETLFDVITLPTYIMSFPEIPYELTISELNDMLTTQGYSLIEIDDTTYTITKSE